MSRIVLLPQDRQADPGPLHLAHQRSPVGFGMAAGAQPGAGRGEQAPFQRLVRQLRWQRPAHPGGGGPRQVILHGAAADADLAGDHPSAGAGTEV